MDVLHHVRTGGGPNELREIVDAGLLGWVQLCDAPLGAPADLLHEARHDRLMPGHGALPLSELLAEIAIDVTISVEVQSDYLANTMAPLVLAQALVDATKQILAFR